MKILAKLMIIVGLIAMISISFAHSNNAASDKFVNRIEKKQELLIGMAFEREEFGGKKSSSKFLRRIEKKQALLENMAMDISEFARVSNKQFPSDYKYILRLEHSANALVSAE